MRKLALAIISILAFALAADASQYRISSGDVLKIDVWGVADLGGDVLVRPDGKITMPAVGEVEATGLAPAEVAAKLAAAYALYVKQPVVTVAVKATAGSRVFVSGGGVASGAVPVPGPITLFRLLSAVGDLTRADLAESWVSRKGKEVYRDFTKLARDGDLTRDFDLEADDIVFIPPNDRKKAYVLGAVAKPTALYVRENVTVLDAILLAGDFTPYADRETITLMRKNGQKTTIPAARLHTDREANVKLEAGDYVIIPSFETDRIYVSGEVRRPLFLPYDRKVKVLDAICAAGGFTERADTSSVLIIGNGGKKIELNLAPVVKGKEMEKNLTLEPGDHIVVGQSIF